MRPHGFAVTLALITTVTTVLPGQQTPVVPAKALEIKAGTPVEGRADERHLKNLRMLTTDGENAEAYWSHDGRKLIFQRRDAAMAADQIYVLDLATGERTLVSTGKGRTTCSYYLQGDRRIVYASTHHHGDAPPVVKMKIGRAHV